MRLHRVLQRRAIAPNGQLNLLVTQTVCADLHRAVGGLAAEGGAWGIAVLAAYLRYADSHSLAEYLDSRVLGGGGALGDAAPAALVIAAPEPADVAGFTSYLDRYRVALDIESAAVASLALLSH